MGHLAKFGEAGTLLLFEWFYKNYKRQVLSKRKRQIDRSMKRAGRIVRQFLTEHVTSSIRNFGHLLTLMVGMRNVGSDNKRPGIGRGIDFSNADPLFLEYAQKDLKPETAVEILKKHGMQVSVTQAKSILEFLQKLADITVTQYLRK